MKKPNFFIIGAPKCGTTSMATWLSEHPLIFMSNPKEPYFFCTDIDVPWGFNTLNKYSQLFQNVGDKHLAVGEATVMYLFSDVAVKNILEFNPAARFIVMLRNPVDMAPSVHGQWLWGDYSQQLIDDFDEYWHSQNAMESLPARPTDPSVNTLINICKLGEQVQRLLQTVDAKSVIFIVMDDLISDPLREYQRVLGFLNVPYDGKSEFSSYNSRSNRPKYKLIGNMVFLLFEVKRLLGIRRGLGLYNKIQNTSSKPHKTKPLRPEFKQELIEFFKEDVKLLSSLLGRDLSNWLK